MMIAALLVPPRFEDVFVSGGTYHTFRIPALCRTRRGTLLAFAEGRRSAGDQSANVLVLRRRPEGAKGWSPTTLIAGDEPASLNNPCVLATRAGRIFLTYQRYPEGTNERTTTVGFGGDRACRTYLLASDDDGLTWGKPRELTAVVASPGKQSIACGPGVGIELTRGPHRGRLVFPLNEGSDGAYDVFALFSDDGGRTWSRGADAPKAAGTQPNETQIAELADGTILMNSRNQASVRARLVCRSADGGATWSAATPDPRLVDPVCQGSLVRLGFRPDLLAFSNADDPKSRRHGVLRISKDGGHTWPLTLELTIGSFAYSCLCPLPGNRVGVLFESEEATTGFRIRYGEVDVAAMVRGR